MSSKYVVVARCIAHLARVERETNQGAGEPTRRARLFLCVFGNASARDYLGITETKGAPARPLCRTKSVHREGRKRGIATVIN